MSFTNIDIQIQELLISDFIPDFVPSINLNNGKLKQEVEKIINNLQIDTSAKKIGTDTPIASVYSRRMEVLADLLTNEGFYLMKTDAGSTVQIAYLKRAEIAGIEGSELMVDKLIVNSVVQAPGASASYADVTVGDTMTSNTLTTLKGLVDIQGGVSESLDFGLLVDMTLVGTEGVAEINLTKTAQQNLFVTIKVANTVYDSVGSAWVGGLTTLKLVLNMDSSYPSVVGQVFNIIVAKLVESNGVTEITTVLPASVSLDLYPGDNDSVIPAASIVFTNSAVTDVEIIADAGTPAPYKKTINIIQVKDGSDDKFHLRNVYTS